MNRKIYLSPFIAFIAFFTFALLGILACLPPARAASFDCNKASTSVEKRICANPQLSNLDSTLDSAYRLVLRSDYPNKDEVRRGQKTWLAERDRCTSDECIQFAYEARITKLEAIFLLKKAKVPESPPLPQNPPVPASLLGAKGTYPPYPDIWDSEARKGVKGILFYSAVSNGDIVLMHKISTKPVKKADGTCCDMQSQYGATLFFSGQFLRLSDDERDPLRDAIRSASIYIAREVQFSDGSLLKRSGYQSGTCHDLSPPYALEIIDRNGRTIAEKYLFIRLDQPVRPQVNNDEDCILTNQPYVQRSKWLLPKIIPLQVDQFMLIGGPPPFIVRFDRNLNTRSPLLNKLIFLVDQHEYKRIVEGVEASLKKRYGTIYPRPVNQFNYNQLVDDAVTRHLDSLRGRK